MWLKKVLITLAVIIAAISNKCSARIRLQNTSGYRENETVHQARSQDTENIAKHCSVGFGSSQIMFEEILANGMKNFLPFSQNNEDCVINGQQYVAGLNNQLRWAIQMYESSTKYPSSAVEFGNFDQCMNVSSKPLGIRGAYALAQIKFREVSDDLAPGSRGNGNTTTTIADRTPMPVGAMDELQWALCFPDSCTNQDVETSVRRALIPVMEQTYRVVVEVTVPPSTYTSARTTMPVTGTVRFIRSIFILGFALVIAGTMYDRHEQSENQSIFYKVICTFSVTRNLKNLVERPKRDSFSIVNGMRAMTMISTIVGHRIILNIGLPLFNPNLNEVNDSTFTMIFKNTIVVELFFVLSGFFMYITINKEMKSEKPFKFINTICNRIYRILPSYIFAIISYIFILPYMSDGPLWKYLIYPETDFCRKNWWTNVMFINNYVNSQEMCLTHSWYLACDMHFFIFGVILTYIIWRWKTIGIGIFGILFAASIYLPAKFIYDNKQLGLLKYVQSDMKNVRGNEFFQKIYIKSHYRFTTYLIGMAAGYIYVQIKNSKFQFSIKSRIIGLSVSLLLHIACYPAIIYFYLPGQIYNPWYHLLYFTLQRVVFSFTISYGIIVGSISNFGYLSRFFESKLFIPISKLSFVLYLFHLIVLYQSLGQIRQPYSGNNWSLYWTISADITTSLIYSLLIHLIVEAPSSKITDLLLDKKKKNDPEKQC